MEELNSLNEQFRQCINDLVNENIQLKKDLATYHHAVNQKGSPPRGLLVEESGGADQLHMPPNQTNNHIYSLPDAMALPPLELPPDVSIPEEVEPVDSS